MDAKKPKDPNAVRDDVLFETLGRNKKKKKRKILTTVICVILVVAILLTTVVMVLRKKVREQFASMQGEVLSHEVQTGTISTVVSGSGSLAEVDLEAVTVPSGVEITEVLVERGDAVQKGDVLATVDMATVISAMATVQSDLDDLDQQISDAGDDKASTTVYAGLSGRVKALYAQADDDVASVMYESGALALISLDGYMAVDIQSDALVPGDAVTVSLADGTEVSGTVETVSAGQATVLISDNGPDCDEEVTVLDGDGNVLASGTLYVHSPLRVTGYAGKVSQVRVKLNDKVTENTRLFTLKDTQYSANYDALLRSREDLEETLMELLTIRRDGAVLAEFDGSVYSVDHTEGSTDAVTLSKDAQMSVTISVDESDILSLEPGQEVTVTVSSVSEEEFSGTLTEINKTGSSSGIYSAEVRLDKAEGMLSGMTAQVSVRIEGVENALLVPVDAVHKTSDGAYVYTSYDEELQEYGGKVDVVTGLENSNYVEIVSGLSQGDTVYYTESESIFDYFGGMSFGGDMSGYEGGGMPESGGEMPNMGGDDSGRTPGNRGSFGGEG